MKVVNFNTLKNERTKLYQEIVQYMETHMYNDFYAVEGNIPQVLQWGNIAKLIFIYYSNLEIHTSEMSEKVSKLKTLSFEIEKTRNFPNIDKKIQDNLGYSDYIVNADLLARSLEDNIPYISKEEASSMLLKIFDNNRLTRLFNKTKRAGGEYVPNIIVEYIADKHFDCQQSETISIYNHQETLKNLNKTHGIAKTEELYRNMIISEKNLEILNFINTHAQIK